MSEQYEISFKELDAIESELTEHFGGELEDLTTACNDKLYDKNEYRCRAFVFVQVEEVEDCHAYRGNGYV